MITGNLAGLERYKEVIPCTEEIISFLDANKLPDVGQWLTLSDRLRVVRLADFNRSSDNFETHNRHYDLHLTLKGQDVMEVCCGFGRTIQTMAYDAEKDYSLFSGVSDSVVKLGAGNWAFILQDEPHRNRFSADDTEKLVFKILA